MKFIDQANIRVKGGDGGHGCIAFLREKFRPKGGPCGGDGGNGGDVILRGNQNLNTILDVSLKKQYKAINGEHGKGKNMHGKNGRSIVIDLPLGTIVKDSITKQIIFDITTNNEEYVVAHGGNGGFGNARYKTQTTTAPRIANDGKTGEDVEIDLELKVLADVGLVGFPNVGKSTFISKISNAKPKVADYPFTTITPNLGIVRYGDYNSFVVADIPGLIEDASKGKGLGTQFLKHIERTKVLVFMLDPTLEDLEKQYSKIVVELDSHDNRINKKKSVILVTKYDLNDEGSGFSKLPKEIDCLSISSAIGYNIEKSIKFISQLLEEN